MVSLPVAIALGILQGVFEWLPISSEGNVALALSVLGASPVVAVQLALFLHLGTAIAATAYYRDEIATEARRLPQWRPGEAFGPELAGVSFLAVATLVSGVVGIVAYRTLVEAVSAIAGGAFIAAVGVLLILTGALQRTAGVVEIDSHALPDAADAVLVGIGQGLAILPGVSRSGTTVGILLLRGHEGETAFRLSFLLSIPAALGAGVLSIADAGGLPGVSLVAGGVAVVVSALVGYLTIDALMRVVRRVAFWAVCTGLGGLAVLGGVVVWFG